MCVCVLCVWMLEKWNHHHHRFMSALHVYTSWCFTKKLTILSTRSFASSTHEVKFKSLLPRSNHIFLYLYLYKFFYSSTSYWETQSSSGVLSRWPNHLISSVYHALQYHTLIDHALRRFGNSSEFIFYNSVSPLVHLTIIVSALFMHRNPTFFIGHIEWNS